MQTFPGSCDVTAGDRHHVLDVRSNPVRVVGAQDAVVEVGDAPGLADRPGCRSESREGSAIAPCPWHRAERLAWRDMSSSVAVLVVPASIVSATHADISAPHISSTTGRGLPPETGRRHRQPGHDGLAPPAPAHACLNTGALGTPHQVIAALGASARRNCSVGPCPATQPTSFGIGDRPVPGEAIDIHRRLGREDEDDLATTWPGRRPTPPSLGVRRGG